MSLFVSFRRSARAGFIEAAAWYESERQNLGVEFIAEIERCVAAAAERPMTYTAAVYKDVRRVVADSRLACTILFVRKECAQQNGAPDWNRDYPVQHTRVFARRVACPSALTKAKVGKELRRPGQQPRVCRCSRSQQHERGQHGSRPTTPHR